MNTNVVDVREVYAQMLQKSLQDGVLEYTWQLKGKRVKFDLSGWKITGTLNEDGAKATAEKFIRDWNSKNLDRPIEGDDHNRIKNYLTLEFLKVAQASRKIEEAKNSNAH